MKRVLGVFLLLLAGVSAGFSQAGTGTVSGTVVDPTRAVVANATVVLSNTSTGLRRTAMTDASGNYKFTNLPVGPGYDVRVTMAGFSATEAKGITTTVGDVITQDFTITAGGETTTIDVGTTNEEQVQVETSAVSQVIDSTVWQDSPLELRSQNSFVGLTAGAASDAGTGRGFAVNGARSGTGNFLVEGMDNNDQGQGGAGSTVGTGGAVTTISPDAIQEYRVISHNPSAEYGRAGGFATDTVLKSGTNKFHGSLFEYNRIQALAAEHYFTNLYGNKDSLIRNQFGGSVGGPIFKDKTFFFATVEIHHLRTATPLTATVTTQAFLNFVDSGAFEAFQETDPNGACMQNLGTTCPGAFSGSAHLGPVFKQLLAAEPRAFPLGTQNLQYAGAGLYTSTSTYPVPVYAQVSVPQKQALNQNRGTMKLDHKLTEKDQLSFTYLIDQEATTTPFAGGETTFGPDEVQIGGSQLFTGNWTHTFTPSLQNLFRAGYTRHVSNFDAPGTAGVPAIATANDPLSSGFGASAGLPQYFTDNEFLYEDSLTKIVRNHTLKSGFRFIRTRNGSSFYNDVKGTLLPWSVEDLVTDETFDDQADRAISGGPTYGSLYLASASVDSTTNAAPDVYRGYRANEFAAYFQDDWKATNKLTLNLGLRWEYFGPPHNAQPGLDSNVYFGTATTTTPNGNPFLPTGGLTAQIQGATFIQKNSNIWNKDTNNFGPRVGFAYDPSGNGRWAIRGGFGIGFDRLYNNVYENIRFNSPHFSDNSIGALVNGVVAGALEQPGLVSVPLDPSLFAAYGAKPVPRHIDQNLVTAYYEQANLGVEHELAKGYVLEVNYIGTFGRKLVGLRDANNYDGRTACTTLNAACAAAGYTAPFTSHRPTTLFNSDNFRSNGFNSNYNGGQVSVRKGYSNGLMFLANYTYSKAMDQISDVFTIKGASGQTGITDPLNPSYDYGPTDFDVRHLASITMNYSIPYKKRNLLLGGWGISPILSVQSGTPFSTVDSNSSYDPNRDGRYVDRAVYVGGTDYRKAVNRSGSPYVNGVLSLADFAPYTCPANVNQGLWCDPPMSRNAFYGPHYTNLDVAVSKRFYLTEVQHFTAQASFFNAFNHTNFNNPISDINNAAQFGKPQTSGDPRVTQLSLRYDF